MLGDHLVDPELDVRQAGVDPVHGRLECGGAVLGDAEGVRDELGGDELADRLGVTRLEDLLHEATHDRLHRAQVNLVVEQCRGSHLASPEMHAACRSRNGTNEDGSAAHRAISVHDSRRPPTGAPSRCAAPARTTCVTSAWTSRSGGSPSSPASPAPASRAWCSRRSPPSRQRLINETYSAFLQGFMGTPPRPDVDRLDNLTPAIIVDQERMGSERALHGRHGDRCLRHAARHLQPARPAAHRSVQRVQLQRAGRHDQRRHHAGARRAARPRRARSRSSGGMCAECEGLGRDVDRRHRRAAWTATKSLNEGAITFPGFRRAPGTTASIVESGFFDPDKPLRDFTDAELRAASSTARETKVKIELAST